MNLFNMAIKKVVALLTLIGVASAGSLIGQRRLVGGTFAVTGDFPYIVSIRSGIHICGGSILDKNHILTAAHCVEGYTENPDWLSIQYGTADISNDDNVIPVVKFTMHSQFNTKTAANDIAVIKLASNIKFGANAKPVKLPTSSSVPTGDAPALLVGWGLTATANGTFPLILKKVTYTKFSDEYCKKKEPDYNPKYQMCAGLINGGIGQCVGDSGGPVTIKGVQYGLVSWSVKPCGAAAHPGVLTSVAKYLNWIQERLQD